MILEAVIGSLAPVAIEGVKQLINRWTGGWTPTSIEEKVQLDNSDINRLKALAELDKPIGNPSQWVVDLRASSRYISAYIIILSGVLSLYIPGLDATVQALLLDASSTCFGFLFGQRVLINMVRK